MTKEHTEQLNAAENAATAPENVASNDAAKPFAAHKPKRTLGLRLFDDFAYGALLNTVVFAASTIMTYWTKHGNTFGREGSISRSIGDTFYSRSKPINEFWGKLGVKSERFRSDLTSVLWSFIDGTAFSLLAKPLENRREKIAKKIDDALGTSPDNLKAYDVEPKQSWGSIFGGRLLTFSIVFPTAYIMNVIGGNERVFLAPGRKLAENVDKILPRLSKWLERKTISTPQQKGDFFGYVFFEGFYTSVCTAGLYFFSRFFARRHPAPEKPLKNHIPTAHADEAAGDSTPDQPREEKPEVTPAAPPVSKVESPGKTEGRVAANEQSVLQTA